MPSIYRSEGKHRMTPVPHISIRRVSVPSGPGHRALVVYQKILRRPLRWTVPLLIVASMDYRESMRVPLLSYLHLDTLAVEFIKNHTLLNVRIHFIDPVLGFRISHVCQDGGEGRVSDILDGIGICKPARHPKRLRF